MFAIGIGIAGLGCGIGMGILANGALQGMARQPDAMPRLMIQMLIAIAFIELIFLLSLFLMPSLANVKPA